MNQLWINLFTGRIPGFVLPALLEHAIPGEELQGTKQAVGSILTFSTNTKTTQNPKTQTPNPKKIPIPNSQRDLTRLLFYPMPASTRKKVEAVSATTLACGTLAGIRVKPPADKRIPVLSASRPICPLIAATICILLRAKDTRLPAASSYSSTVKRASSTSNFFLIPST